MVVTYRPKRAAKDRKDRERAVKKLEKKLKTGKQVKRLINSKSYLKYTEIAGEASAKIDEEKIEKDAQWDGLHGVLTNKPVSGCEVYQDYRRHRLLSALRPDAKLIYEAFNLKKGLAVTQIE